MAMIRRHLGAVLVCFLAGGPVSAQDAPEAASSNTVKLVRVVVDIPAGTPVSSLGGGPGFCLYGPSVKKWPGGRVEEAVPAYAVPFKTELERAGYKVVTPGVDNLFDPETGAADYEIAAVIMNERVEGCVSNGSFAGRNGSIHGTATMNIAWQLFSPIRKQVVAHINTSGSFNADFKDDARLPQMIIGVFGENVRQLASGGEFRTAVNGAKPLTNGVVLPGKQDKLVLAGSLKTQKMPISDAVGSVVTVLTGSGSGSAFLVSTDGYMLTNAHVVGDEKSVRVRWSDAIETVADVVRVEKVRDVAVIKTSARDRTPFALKRGAVVPGARVYAIGSPKGKDYQGTVSSGVISASRIMEGLRYIQSDVPVSHGSSGGTLLDENGAVIGIAVAGDERVDAHGLNFFIPIGDAMDFLNLEPK